MRNKGVKGEKIKKEILCFKTRGYINCVLCVSHVRCYPSEKGKKGLLDTSQGEGGYNNVVDDKIIFIYLFSLCEAIYDEIQALAHTRVNEVDNWQCLKSIRVMYLNIQQFTA